MNKSHHISLEQAQSLWMAGEWRALDDLKENLDKSSPDYPHILLYIFSANLQFLKKYKNASQLKKYYKNIKELKKLGIEKERINSFIFSGVKNNLARAFFINGDAEKARIQFSQALSTILGSVPAAITNARSQTQIAELAKHSKELNYLGVKFSLEAVHNEYPDEPSILIAQAENAQQHKKNADAIRHWQNAAALMQNLMPQTYYARLSQAYLDQRSFPMGTAEEEALKGSVDKYEILKHLHKVLKPKKYLEIGVQTGKSLLLAECEAIGVDPMPYPNIKLGPNHQILRMTSDEFFKTHADDYLKEPPDLVFIDGMHLFEFALRDFLNVERYASKNTVVVIDDIFPGHPAQAERERRTRAWTGDVWKVIEILEEYRKDLWIEKIDAYPTGVACIRCLAPGRNEFILQEEKFLSDYKEKNIVPQSFIDRKNSVQFDQFAKDKILNEVENELA